MFSFWKKEIYYVIYLSIYIYISIFFLYKVFYYTKEGPWILLPKQGHRECSLCMFQTWSQHVGDTGNAHARISFLPRKVPKRRGCVDTPESHLSSAPWLTTGWDIAVKEVFAKRGFNLALSGCKLNRRRKNLDKAIPWQAKKRGGREEGIEERREKEEKEEGGGTKKGGYEKRRYSNRRIFHSKALILRTLRTKAQDICIFLLTKYSLFRTCLPLQKLSRSHEKRRGKQGIFFLLSWNHKKKQWQVTRAT